MTIETAIALLVAMIICAASPGPGVFACIAKALGSGFKGTIFVICGIVAGNITFLIFAILGLSAIAQMLGGLFIIIKWMGCAYLFWLGWNMWRAEPAVLDSEKCLAKEKIFSDFVGGLFIPFSNPKVILFYVSLLPSFIDLSALNYLDILLAAFLIAFALVLVLAVYAYIASRSRQLFRSPRALKNLNRGAGGAMMGTGVIVASQYS